MIYVHELGHFLAAKWRGAVVNRFQIWFGKPIWNRKINGVNYSLGWIPAGGFVSLPQMASMKELEGTEDNATLPKLKPLDKIIVAFAGPLFSFLLALLFACLVWGTGKPEGILPTQVVGYVQQDSPAQIAGILPGDEILEINDKPVEGFWGSLKSIRERIILSKGEQLNFLIKRRQGDQEKQLILTSYYELPETKWFQRKGVRRIGILPKQKVIVGSLIAHSPAELAGLKPQDQLLQIDGEPILNPAQIANQVAEVSLKPIQFLVQRGAEKFAVAVTPKQPVFPEESKPMLGIYWDRNFENQKILVYPNPWVQTQKSLQTLWVTLTSVFSPRSSLDVQHLSGPIGILSHKAQLLMVENGWRLVLWFSVVLNINLAVMNLLPFPVLDGGHILLSIGEWLFRKPLPQKPLELLQSTFAIALIGLMLFITSKDLGDKFNRSSASKTQQAPVFKLLDTHK